MSAYENNMQGLISPKQWKYGKTAETNRKESPVVSLKLFEMAQGFKTGLITKTSGIC